MLSALLAHTGRPPAPHDLWASWALDPVLLLAGAVTVATYVRGRPRRPLTSTEVGRARCFAAGVVAVGVALVSPLDAASSALASAHMVQHLLLVLVAAPLLAISAPGSRLVRGMPAVVQRAGGGTRRRWRRATGAGLEHPAVAWIVHVGALWFWHAAGPYGAALDHDAVHAVEHATFLATGVLFWHVVVGGRTAGRVPFGLGVLLLFGMAMQSTGLSLLLTFAESPWYAGYATTTAAWGLSPLGDQQLAGLIMWVPAGVVYVVVALVVLAVGLRDTERDALVA